MVLGREHQHRSIAAVQNEVVAVQVAPRSRQACMRECQSGAAVVIRTWAAP